MSDTSICAAEGCGIETGGWEYCSADCSRAREDRTKGADGTFIYDPEQPRRSSPSPSWLGKRVRVRETRFEGRVMAVAELHGQPLSLKVVREVKAGAALPPLGFRVISTAEWLPDSSLIHSSDLDRDLGVVPMEAVYAYEHAVELIDESPDGLEATAAPADAARRSVDTAVGTDLNRLGRAMGIERVHFESEVSYRERLLKRRDDVVSVVAVESWRDELRVALGDAKPAQTPAQDEWTDCADPVPATLTPRKGRTTR